jgi:hypothetical protein
MYHRIKTIALSGLPRWLILGFQWRRLHDMSERGEASTTAADKRPHRRDPWRSAGRASPPCRALRLARTAARVALRSLALLNRFHALAQLPAMAMAIGSMAAWPSNHCTEVCGCGSGERNTDEADSKRKRSCTSGDKVPAAPPSPLASIVVCRYSSAHFWSIYRSLKLA